MDDGPGGPLEPLLNGAVEPPEAGEDNSPPDYSSESDALVIDEATTKRPPPPLPIPIAAPPSSKDALFNPYFNESIFDLSRQHRKPPRKLKKNSPKLREYAQYLGLQPTVQFKCSRCCRTGFETLSALNEHLVQCRAEPVAEQAATESSPSSTFKLTRKVFLCSACGTYYENWNLYLHMIEVHRRYLCLYCLGMFSVLDDLCLHIQSRHNFEPGHKENLDEFYKTYTEPCYLVCCDCARIFNERDNFFYHACTGLAPKTRLNGRPGPKTKIKTAIRPEDHVTGDSSATAAAPGGEKVINNLTAVIPAEVPAAITTGTNLAGGDEDEEEDDGSDIDTTVKSPEIDYSSESDLEFRGFNSEGEFIFLEKPYYDEPQPMAAPPMIEPESPPLPPPPPPQPEVETRKVPKLSLKLKPGSFPEIEQVTSDDSDTNKNNTNLDVEEPLESEPELCNGDDVGNEETYLEERGSDGEPEIAIASADVDVIELELEQPLDKFDIKILLQKCLNATAPTCIYCNHARKIAVNGKRLGLHAIAQHRYSAVVSSITAEELIPESFVNRIKESLNELDDIYFSLESNVTSDGGVTFSHLFECFQCRYATPIHKELYLHNRKLHTKNLLLCIMCKTNFFNYSELICHLCPGIYILDHDVQFRCCLCVSDELPSAFRLMVHLRKRHHVCDVCLESCHNQYRLSNHVWKHKLHHFCYRCGIAYRNKPDITRHLFWKHGTESVECKKCLQKKWPHVYHFCVPPASFICEECQLTFSRAVSLKVHKRIHTEEKPHQCTIDDCQEKFISKKLLLKHEQKHREPPEEIKPEPVEEVKPEVEPEVEPKTESLDEEKVEQKPPVKPKVDVYDLPELNLSESDSSDSESELAKPEPIPTTINEDEKTTEEVVFDLFNTTETDQIISNEDNFSSPPPALQQTEEPTPSEVVLENIWDDFKNYQASKEKFDNLLTEVEKSEQPQNEGDVIEELTLEKVLLDHDYCIDPNNKPDVTYTEVKPDLGQSEVDHDYCSAKGDSKTDSANTDPTVKLPETKEEKSPRKRSNSSSSDSSSDSSSSSCSCGPNCSCSSSSGSSSSTSDSSDSDSSTEEGRKRQQARRDRRRQKKNPEQAKSEQRIEVVVPDQQNVVFKEMPIHESDLETTESETDEEFYDKKPHLFAKKILEEKRNQLLAGIEATPNGVLLETSRPETPNLPEETKPKKKSKSKKKKKKKDRGKEKEPETDIPAQNQYYHHQQYYQPPTVAPITLTLSRNSPLPTPSAKLPPKLASNEPESSSRDDSDMSLRASKRRRVPNKFYGYSSDEEEAGAAPKWRKTEPPPALAPPPLMVPPITIKTTPTVMAQPFSIRPSAPSRKPLKVKVKPPLPPPPLPPPPVPQSLMTRLPPEDGESEAESNDSSNEGRNMLQVDPDALYCYCKCPYDEVSEMIGCDARDCSIEWFHFECVGIMVPPKGHWYCPECRKKRQQKREMLKLKAKAAV